MAENPVEIGAITEALNSKVDTDVGNTNATGNAVIAHYAMPSDKYENVTWGSSGDKFTAPADGYYTCTRISTTTPQYLSIRTEDANGNALLEQAIHASGTNQYLSLTVPIAKGQRFVVFFNGSTAQNFKFIYAKGSEPQS